MSLDSKKSFRRFTYILKPVSLMESLDSTLETKRPAAALSLLSQQKQQQQVVASPDGKKSTCISFLW